MIPNTIDVICFSHLRWSFVFQRPQHLMSRFARYRRVFFLEEPVFEEGEARLRQTLCKETGVHVLTPVLPHGMDSDSAVLKQRALLENMLLENRIRLFIAWLYTPMAREIAFNLQPVMTIYDCMDELSAFAGAPPALRRQEQALFADSDLVFTGGASLYSSKQREHNSVHLFPSSVDVQHFAAARTALNDPEDQAALPRPRFGYAGVIDERMNLNLLRDVAKQRPDWQIVLLGPVVKIDSHALPRLSNIHYLGMKAYRDLPAYMSGWDVGMLPFALNESTRFISPTKTPEYLAAGLPVISTPIRDVVTPYGSLGLVSIAQGAKEFIAKGEKLLALRGNEKLRDAADKFLSQSSWEKTWKGMNELMNMVFQQKSRTQKEAPAAFTERPAVAAKGAVHV